MSKRVLIIGCGQLGSRHLQAVASLSEVSHIEVYDRNAQSLALGRSRLEEISDRNPEIKISWHQKLEDCSAQGDLCIIATQASGRCALIEQVARDLGFHQFLAEKIMSQTLKEYEHLLDFCRSHQVQGWVNCKSRDYVIHQHIKSKLNPQETLVMAAVAGNHGLANNGIHEADLFVFYDECKEIEVVEACIDPVVHPSKRGAQIYDFSGLIRGRSGKGSELIIDFKREHMAPDLITITTASSRFIIDHFQKFALESYAANQWAWATVPIEANWAVSHMTKKFVRDIFKQGQCTLPTFEQCYPAHRFILEALLPTANQILHKTDDVLSVT